MAKAGSRRVTVRQPREQERDALAVLEVNAFRSNFEDSRRRMQTADLNEVLCLFEDGQLASSLTVHPYAAYVGGNTLPLGGIGGVMTFADKQGRGYATRLLGESLRVMRRRGLALSTLYPFSFAYYRRLGWAGAACHFLYPELTQRNLPAFEERRLVEHFNPGDDIRPLIGPHNRAMRRYNLCFRRDLTLWRKLVDKFKERRAFLYVIRDRGRVIGWFACHDERRRNGGGHESTVWSMALADRTALRALLGFLAALPESVKNIQLHLPVDLDLWNVLKEPPATTVRADQQLRIVNLADAIRLRGYRPGSTGRLVLRIIDPNARWNQGTWSIRWARGKAASINRVAEPPMLTADIAEFAQVYCGYKTARELADAGKIEVHAPRPAAMFDLLDRLFHDRPTHTQDWF